MHSRNEHESVHFARVRRHVLAQRGPINRVHPVSSIQHTYQRDIRLGLLRLHVLPSHLNSSVDALNILSTTFFFLNCIDKPRWQIFKVSSVDTYSQIILRIPVFSK